MEFELKFTEQEVNLLLKGLGELPAKESIGLIGKISQECEAKIAESKIEQQ